MMKSMLLGVGVLAAFGPLSAAQCDDPDGVPPSLDAPQDKSVAVGQSYLDAAITDNDVSYDVEFTGAPAGMNIKPTPDTTVLGGGTSFTVQGGGEVVFDLKWTPGPGDIGQHCITVEVTSAGGSLPGCTVTATFCIEVSECFLFVGTSAGAWPVGGPGDYLLVAPLLVFPVTLETMPQIAIPDDPSLLGFDVYAQVGMLNPAVFPADPVRMSNGLHIVLGDPNLPSSYGVPSGLHLFAQQPALVPGAIDLMFSIDYP